jgi:hypothetical protein
MLMSDDAKTTTNWHYDCENALKKLKIFFIVSYGSDESSFYSPKCQKRFACNSKGRRQAAVFMEVRRTTDNSHHEAQRRNVICDNATGLIFLVGIFRTGSFDVSKTILRLDLTGGANYYTERLY